jgi:hypothetical protein
LNFKGKKCQYADKNYVIRLLITCALHQILLKRWGGVCSTCIRVKKATKFYLKNMKERECFGGLCIDERIIYCGVIAPCVR